METLENKETLLPEENKPAKEEIVKKQSKKKKEVVVELPVESLNVEESVQPAKSESEKEVAAEELLSFSEVLEKIRESIQLDKPKMEIARLKSLFYRKYQNFQEQGKQEFMVTGGKEEDYAPIVVEEETELKNLLVQYKEKRGQELAKAEKEKSDKLQIKEGLLERLKLLVESTEDVNKTFPIIKELQQEWNNIGSVPSEKYKELVRKYQLYLEQFYDFVKISNELRDYDFKKNYDAKVELCKDAENLLEEKDINQAFKKLQILHSEWRELGPVAREYRETLWQRFKLASETINKNHAVFYEGKKGEEEQNLAKKEELCQLVENVRLDEIKTYKGWEEKTQEILKLQEAWKNVGFAPKKNNTKIYDRFRKACDTFFIQKSLFYKESKALLNTNLDKKRLLCEKAEALKDSKDWKVTTDELIRLQQEWKTIGPVSKKVSDYIWKRFIVACDFFFAEKEKEFKGKNSEQTENLAKKKEIIAEIIAYQGSAVEGLKELTARYAEIGHVPFKEKDKIYNEYRKAIDDQFNRLKINDTDRKLSHFKTSIAGAGEKSTNGLYREREKLVRAYEQIKSDIATRENNFGFLNAKSKKSGTLIEEMEHNLEKLKEERDLILKKIQLLDETI